MNNIIDFINKAGGSAKSGKSLNKRISWSNDVKDSDKEKIRRNGN